MVARDQAGEVVRVDPARQVVARGDRAEGAGVVVEAGGVVDPRRLRRHLAVAGHALDGVVEPPRRPEAQRGVVARQRRQLPRVGGLVEGEENQPEARVVPIGDEQVAQVPRVLGGDRDVAAFVRPKRRKTPSSWLRRLPGWICITMPSSADIARSPSACGPRTRLVGLRRLAGRARAKRASASASGSRSVHGVVGGSVEVAPGSVESRAAPPAEGGGERSSTSTLLAREFPEAGNVRPPVGARDATRASGRNAGARDRPSRDRRSAAWCSSESLAASVVVSISMLNRSNSARGRNSGDASFSGISS